MSAESQAARPRRGLSVIEFALEGQRETPVGRDNRRTGFQAFGQPRKDLCFGDTREFRGGGHAAE